MGLLVLMITSTFNLPEVVIHLGCSRNFCNKISLYHQSAFIWNAVNFWMTAIMSSLQSASSLSVSLSLSHVWFVQVIGWKKRPQNTGDRVAWWIDISETSDLYKMMMMMFFFLPSGVQVRHAFPKEIYSHLSFPPWV